MQSYMIFRSVYPKVINIKHHSSILDLSNVVNFISPPTSDLLPYQGVRRSTSFYQSLIRFTKLRQ